MAKFIKIKPQKTIDNITAHLGDRNKYVVFQRFGLGDNQERKTLDAIGKKFNITRERVRQIENFTLNRIKQHPSFKSAEEIFAILEDFISNKGGVVSEQEIFDAVDGDSSQKNPVYFFLTLGDKFVKVKEDDSFYSHWTTDAERAEKVRQAIHSVHGQITPEDLFAEQDIVNLLKKSAEEKIDEEIKSEIIKSWLNISKIIGSNALNEWGHRDSANISPKGVRDYALLVLKKHGSPLHFREIAAKISDLFSRKANPSTTHNELIKDESFVLVGRGLYALSDWGYKAGTVKDLIEDAIKEKGPLAKEEIIEMLLKERQIKENTILVNLQNRRFFKKIDGNKYIVVA